MGCPFLFLEQLLMASMLQWWATLIVTFMDCKSTNSMPLALIFLQSLLSWSLFLEGNLNFLIMETIFVSDVTWCTLVSLPVTVWFSNVVLVDSYQIGCCKHLQYSVSWFGIQHSDTSLEPSGSWRFPCTLIGKMLGFDALLHIFVHLSSWIGPDLTWRVVSSSVDVLGFPLAIHYIVFAILESFAPYKNLIPACHTFLHTVTSCMWIWVGIMPCACRNWITSCTTTLIQLSVMLSLPLLHMLTPPQSWQISDCYIQYNYSDAQLWHSLLAFTTPSEHFMVQ